MSQTKRNSLLLLSAAGILVLILAMSLPNLTLSPGQWFSFEQPETENSSAADDEPPRRIELERLVRGLLALSLILLPIHIIYSLLTSEGRQRLIMNGILVAALFLLGIYLSEHPLKEGSETEDPATSNSIGLDGVTLPTAELPPDPPSWLTLTAILAFSTLVVAFLFAIIGYVRHRSRITTSSLEELAETAQNTIESLRAGGNFEDAVIRCYHEMSRVIKEDRGVMRETAMTPREFETELISRGLPREAVGTLTRLFEQVRYGRVSSGKQEENLAIACLTDIVAVCKAPGASYDSA